MAELGSKESLALLHAEIQQIESRLMNQLGFNEPIEAMEQMPSALEADQLHQQVNNEPGAMGAAAFENQQPTDGFSSGITPGE
jgi:hypothetical protein